MESQYGKGLVVNLAKFSEHLSNDHIENCYQANRWIQDQTMDTSRYDISFQRAIQMFRDVYLKVHGEPKKALSSMIELWANGATDHLYDLQVPKSWKKTSIAKDIEKLRKLGLTMGHGFTRQIWTIEDVTKLRKLVQKICVNVDKRIGIKKGDWGQY